MNSRDLTPDEKANLIALNELGIESSLLFVTKTGLDKSLLDATSPVRELFSHAGLHDYAAQLKGPENKVMREAVILTDDGSRRTSASFYRPITKDGDPRFWIYGLKEYANPDHVFSLFILGSKLHALNLTASHLALLTSPGAYLTSYLEENRPSSRSIAEELLQMLRELAEKGPIRAVCSGDTAVGRSIEGALGIEINSSRAPDFKGIEIKSGRSAIISKETRATLFACVPDWDLSALKSSAAILERFGYNRGPDFKLYCTVSCRKPNSQGLQFRIEDAARWLHEVARRDPEERVAVWTLSRLEERLRQKHRETFWIKAKSEDRGDGFWFHLQSVTHTQNPNVLQFERLLSEGIITMDHLIKRKQGGRVSEKGPLFKIVRQRIPELFLGKPKMYELC